MAAVDPPVRLIMVISLAAEAYATGWESFNGSSYYITAAHMHWDCVTACGEASAKMACLTSSDENAFAASMIRAHGVAFIGTYNPAPKDEHWRCASGEVGRRLFRMGAWPADGLAAPCRGLELRAAALNGGLGRYSLCDGASLPL